MPVAAGPLPLLPALRGPTGGRQGSAAGVETSDRPAHLTHPWTKILYQLTICIHVQNLSGGDVVRAMTRDEVRGAIANLDPAESKVRLPGWFDEIAWDKLDYLAWRDSRAPLRAYLVADIDGTASGLLLRQAPSRAELGKRSVMCALCHFMRRFNEVALFTAPRPSADKRQRLSTLGILLCTDLDCDKKVHSTPVTGPLDPPVDEIIQARREGLQTRTVAFLRSVSNTRGTVRGRG